LQDLKRDFDSVTALRDFRGLKSDFRRDLRDFRRDLKDLKRDSE
jgi:hypothetical protein